VPLPKAGINDTAAPEPLDDIDDDDDDDDIKLDADKKRVESVEDPGAKKHIDILYKQRFWTPIANWLRSRRLRRQEGLKQRMAMKEIRPKPSPVPTEGKVPDGHPESQPKEEKESHNR
jgi:hypothetical protein